MSLSKTIQPNRKMAGKLSSLEFACAVAGLKLSDKAMNAALRVLVAGESQTAVAHDMGELKQTVYNWITRVVKAHQKLVAAMAEAVPEGWAAEIIALPEDQMRQVRVLADIAAVMLQAQNLDKQIS